MKGINQLPSDTSSEKRKAALVCLGLMAEGCCDEMEKYENLKTLLITIRKHLSDPHAECRKVTCDALSQFAAHLQPTMLEFHKVSQFLLLFSNFSSFEFLRTSKILIWSYKNTSIF